MLALKCWHYTSMRKGTKMLVLSRRSGEVVTIGPEIRVVVLGIEGGRVKLGFIAPEELVIHREEVSQRAAGIAPRPWMHQPLLTR